MAASCSPRYAYEERKNARQRATRSARGWWGRRRARSKRILVTDVPADYIRISSVAGRGARRCNIVVVPILFEGEVKGVLELASFQRFTDIQLAFLEQLVESLGIVVATIEATMRTDELLRQSQSMAEELQTQQEELQQTNEELEEKARQLTEQKAEVERKNREVELAKEELEEKAEQLALTSPLQVAVPGQHVARAAHAAQQPADPVAPAVATTATAT